MRYDAIFEWNMTPPETEAFKLAVLYEREFLKQFSGTDDLQGQWFRMNTIPKKGDPRKSNLFRHCWQLRRETRGLLNSEQYENYIKANMLILKLNHAHVSPNVICGDGAWIRWKVWERWYNQKMAEKNDVSPPPSVSSTDPKLVREIDRTKKFLFEKSEGEAPSSSTINMFVENGFFKLWIATGKVSIYYVMMSPYMKKFIEKFSKECSFDPLVYQEKITSEVKDYFNHEFKYEFSGNQ